MSTIHRTIHSTDPEDPRASGDAGTRGVRPGGPAPADGGRARRRLRRAVDARRRALLATREAGMATAEYAIATVAAAGFAGLLLVVLRSDEVRETLTGLVRSALAV